MMIVISNNNIIRMMIKINNIIIMIMISNTPAGVKKQAEGGSYPLYQLVNLNGDGDGDDRGGAQDAET